MPVLGWSSVLPFMVIWSTLVCCLAPSRFRALSMSTIPKYPRERLAGPSPVLEGSPYRPSMPISPYHPTQNGLFWCHLSSRDCSVTAAQD
ncbi:hypothetical protein CGCF413_v010409 [Colletotrichum fructicola]|nr:hypothetical protein CGCF413_v010409 [Colletotrichum fructicola]